MVRSFSIKGFTFVELVIVIATLTILVLSLAPLDNLSNIYVEAAAQRLEQDFRYARELAMTKNINCGLQISLNGDYTVYEITPLTPTLNPLTRQSFIYNLVNDFKGVNILNLVSTLLIEFDPLGKPVLGSGATIQVGNSQKTISLVVTPNTGLITRM